MITVVGAGPIGSYLSYLLAKDGFDVSIYEEHPAVGLPVQCTGLVTGSIDNFLTLSKDSVVNKVNDVRVYAPDNSFLEFSFRRPDLILDRAAFDNELLKKAEDRGVLIFPSHRLVRLYRNNAVFKTAMGKLSIPCKTIVGADGPLSLVAKQSGLFKNRSFCYGFQAVVKMKNDNKIEFYPYIGTIAWVVPVDCHTARIGVMAKVNPKQLFFDFLKKKGAQPVEIQAGLVPIWNPRISSCIENTFLVGDAAAQVKATTGGGIVPGLKGASILANAISKNSSYELALKTKLFPELFTHKLLRGMLDRLLPQDYNLLISECKDRKVQTCLSEVDRDHSLALLMRIISRKPSLLRFLSRFA